MNAEVQRESSSQHPIAPATQPQQWTAQAPLDAPALQAPQRAAQAYQLASDPTADTPPLWVRGAVRDILGQTAEYATLDPADRRALAHAMVKVSTLAANLILEENDAQRSINTRATPRRPPIARAQAQPDFGAASDRIASTTRNILNAVSFPRFVTDLINGVFKAMLDSNAQQMHQYVDLLNNVSASLEGFANSQFTDDSARAWLVDKFPTQFELPDPKISDDGPVDPQDVEPTRLRIRDGAHMPEVETLRTVFGMGPDESIDASNPEQLVPLAKRQIARQRQQMLSTMVMLGMQRIVIDSGSIHASMHFHIDTRDAANADQGSTLDIHNRAKASGKFGAGPWGVSAELENTIGYVSTQRSQSTEEMNTDLDLNSSVDLNFRSDYVPLNRMATPESASRIRANSLNPEAEAALAKSTTDRENAQRAAELERQKATNAALTGAMQPAQPARSDSQAPTRPNAGNQAGSGAQTGAGQTGGAQGGATQSGSNPATAGQSRGGQSGQPAAGQTGGGTQGAGRSGAGGQVRGGQASQPSAGQSGSGQPGGGQVSGSQFAQSGS